MIIFASVYVLMIVLAISAPITDLLIKELGDEEDIGSKIVNFNNCAIH